jgi:hypothetical protein
MDMPFSALGHGIRTTSGESYQPIWDLVGETFGRSLAEMNDRSFNEIADRIDAGLIERRFPLIADVLT